MPHHHDHQHQDSSDRSQQSSAPSSSGNDNTILVDAANVAFTNHNEPHAKGSVENILAMRKTLEDLGYHPIFIADASLKYEIDDPHKLNQLEQSGQIKQAPAGTQADYFLLAYAKQQNLPIVSNDEFRDRKDEFSNSFHHRVPFVIINGNVVIDKERLPKHQQAA